MDGLELVGSAEMRGICGQMVDGGMSFDEAVALAEANRYIARIVSIDGEFLMVTADFAPNRYGLSMTNGRVTGCSRG